MIKTATCAAACALAFFGPLNGAIASEPVSAPESGTFQGEVYVDSASGTGCLDKAGYAFIGSLSFPGMSGTTYTLRALETGSGVAFVSVQTLTVKSGKGTTSPSGSLSWVGGGVGGSWTENGTFTSTIAEIGTHAFVLQLTEKYSGCTEDINVPLARIGVNQ